MGHLTRALLAAVLAATLAAPVAIAVLAEEAPSTDPPSTLRATAVEADEALDDPDVSSSASLSASLGSDLGLGTTASFVLDVAFDLPLTATGVGDRRFPGLPSRIHHHATITSDADGEGEGVRTAAFAVEDAGTVTIDHTDDQIVDVRVQVNDGWEHDVRQRDDATVHVGFSDGQTGHLFTATVHDGQVATWTITRERTDPAGPTDPPQQRTQTYAVEDAGQVTITWDPDQILDVDVEAAPEWEWRRSDRHDRAVAVGFWDGEQGVAFTAWLDPDGNLQTRVDGPRKP